MKPLKALNIFLLAALIVVLALNWILEFDPSQPSSFFMPEMVFSVPYDAFSANPVFADGKTFREPVPGTIARGHMPLHYEPTPEGAALAARELQNPMSADDPRSLKRGAFVYLTFCQPCHGVSGKGDGAISLRGYPPPPSLFTEKALNMRDGQMFHVLTYGQGNMPSYASQLSREDRWNVIMQVRALQKMGASSSEE